MSISIRKRRARGGFTLVELMIVVGILAALATIAARLSGRAPRGEKASAFARQLIIAAHEARETAITVGATTRLRMLPSGTSYAGKLITERLDPNSNTWLPIGGGAVAPSGVELCSVQSGVQTTTTTQPTCPNLTDTRVCFSPTGRVAVTSNDVCPATAFTGATLYAHTTDGGTNAKKYKVTVYRLTGLARLWDRW